jgi:hypothetical protein
MDCPFCKGIERGESGKMKVESGKFYKPKMIVVADTTPLISLLKM